MKTKPTEDYYRALEVEPHADDDELKRAWKRLAMQWHPDHAGPGATGRFQLIATAYAVLSDPDARAAYDRWRGTTKPRQSDALPRRAPSVMLRRLTSQLSTLILRGIARETEGSNIIDLMLDPEEAEHGGMATITMRVPVKQGDAIVEDLFSAWIAIRPGVADGTILTPSAWLPGMVEPVYFRVRL